MEHKEDKELTWDVYLKEVLPFWLFVTKGYGITAEDINWSCPADLQPYADAHKYEMRELDSYIHAACGHYMLSAFSVAVERNLAGDKAKQKYVNEPLMESLSKDDGLTQEEIVERELRKMIAAERAWISVQKAKGKPETVLKK